MDEWRAGLDHLGSANEKEDGIDDLDIFTTLFAKVLLRVNLARPVKGIGPPG